MQESVSYVNVLIKIINFLPRSWLAKIGNSRFSSTIINQIRKKGFKKWYELDYGIKVYFDPTDPHLIDMINDRDPEKNVKEIFLANINSGSIIIDVGANIGDYTLIASKKVGDSGKIYSFEPYIESFKILEKNLKINNITNVVPINLGVSKESGNRDLYLQDNFAIGNSIYGERNSKSKIQIKTISLRDIINEYKITKIDFLKLDCEGSEYEILLNLDKISLDKIERIVAEMHPDIEDYKIKDVIDFLNVHKFDVKIIKPTQDDSELVMLYAIREKSNKQ